MSGTPQLPRQGAVAGSGLAAGTPKAADPAHAAAHYPAGMAPAVSAGDFRFMALPVLRCGVCNRDYVPVQFARWCGPCDAKAARIARSKRLISLARAADSHG